MAMGALRTLAMIAIAAVFLIATALQEHGQAMSPGVHMHDAGGLAFIAVDENDAHPDCCTPAEGASQVCSGIYCVPVPALEVRALSIIVSVELGRSILLPSGREPSGLLEPPKPV